LGLGLIAAVGVLIASVAVFADHAGRGPRAFVGVNGAMGGTGGAMMGTVWLAGNGATVTSIAIARDRAAKAGAAAGLHPGEVIWFDNGFYVELKDAADESATEVIVEPTGGAVFTEPGPAMMWNTRYGMHNLANGPGAAPVIDEQRALQIATDWLGTNLAGRIAQPPDSYPGYYTSETTTSNGTINGMLSVNSTTGRVWYHSWHGRFIAKEDT
jgi:hypothetical protein